MTNDLKEILPWASAIFIGLLTVLTNYIISYQNRKTTLKAVKLEFNKSILSTNRQVWINNLRDLISDYLAKSRIHKLNIEANYLSVEKEFSVQYSNKLEEVFQVSGRIALMLNPNEEDSSKLIELLERFNTALFDRTVITQTPEYFQQEILRVTQVILKNEWEKVKRGE